MGSGSRGAGSVGTGSRGPRGGARATGGPGEGARGPRDAAEGPGAWGWRLWLHHILGGRGVGPRRHRGGGGAALSRETGLYSREDPGKGDLCSSRFHWEWISLTLVLDLAAPSLILD